MRILTLGATLLGLILAARVAAQQIDIEQAFNDFRQAASIEEATAMIDEILQSGISFEEAYQKLQNGKDYEAADTGVVLRSYTAGNGTEYFYHLNVPESYDPALEYKLRFELHGGIGGRENNRPGGRGRGQTRLEGEEQIYVMPYAWLDSPWWDDSQVENIRNILDLVKREYNINENRVVLGGISDGATGTWYIAMRENTRFAAFYSFIGYLMVLGNSTIADGTSFMQNLSNKSWFVINGARDRLYPTSRVTPFINYLQNSGLNIEYHPLPDGEHNTQWWPQWRDAFEAYVNAHPRNPHPAMISWKATEGINKRSHWLQIEELDPARESVIPLFEVGVDPGNGVPVLDMVEAGRVDVIREGNSIQAISDGVASFRLLLSPEVIDFERPVTVTVNNVIKFQGLLEPDLETLLRWAAADNDRKMLYGAELLIEL